MNEQDSKAEIFDVFLCHNSVDKPAVREIAQMLVKEGIKPWLDEEQIRPGTSWQKVLGEQIGSINSAAVFLGDGGLGPWQNQEMQSFLNRFVNRKCAVIPVILAYTKATPDLPWPLANLHCVDFRTDSQPLERLIWGITGQKPAEFANVSVSKKPPTMQEATPRLIAGDEEARSGNVISGARLYPALAEPPDPDNATQLNILRKRVVEYWVDGVLKHSLYNEVLIALDRRQVGNAVDAPWKYTVEVSEGMNPGPLDERDVSLIYDATGLLLILGEPGSGKTTTLLDLARALLDRAGDDLKERVAVVLNLSSWKNKQPLAEWISIELSEKYRVPRKIVIFWLQQGYLLPLLDGLDEIETSMQPDCVTAINAFIEEFQPSGLVVCCRLNEYRWLPKRLKLNGAIRIEPLSSEEVRKYLAGGGSKLEALRGAIDADPVLNDLAQTPLMLSIMSLAYQGVRGDELVTPNRDSPEERRKLLFDLYVKRMFQRKATTPHAFPKERTIGWLSWLAREMREHSQSVFLVEGLQPNWLAQQGGYKTAVVLSARLIFVLIFGLIGALIGGLFGRQLGLINGLIGGLILGLGIGEIVGMLGGLFDYSEGDEPDPLDHISLVETVSWNWNKFLKGTIVKSIVWLIIILVMSFLISEQLTDSEKLAGWLILVLISWIFFVLSAGVIDGITDAVKMGKASPNEGIELSLRNSLAVSLVTLLIFGLIFGLIGGLVIAPLAGLSTALLFGLSAALIFGPIIALAVGLRRGGSDVIKHFALRLILCLNGYTPLKFIRFLDHCDKLILLKKVGGGYIFIHRMLLDYFADITLNPRKVNAGKRSRLHLRPLTLQIL